jgi:hypothetical protein
VPGGWTVGPETDPPIRTTVGGPRFAGCTGVLLAASTARMAMYRAEAGTVTVIDS